MKWFKFYGQDYLSDPKMLSLTSEERSCWITLLCYSSVNDNGMITFMNEQQLMFQAGLSVTDDCWDRTVGVLKKLENLQMIANDNGMITVLNWKKRQETSLTSYERVKKYRQKKQDDNAKITLEENRIEENRIDKREDTPSQIAKDFFNKGKIYEEMLALFTNDHIPTYEFDKFILYWTEPNKSGTRVRWQQEPTFEIKRRLTTWINRSNSFSQKKETKIL